MTTRRGFCIAFGAAALTGPLGALAQQQGKVWRVGFLAPRRPVSLDSDNAFVLGMRELGYVEGKNLVIEWRFADGKFERLPELAAELIRLKVHVIVASGTPATSAARKATTKVPIVFWNQGDPVGSGFVASLARPGGNITGFSNFNVEVVPKQLEILLAMVPKLAHVAVLGNPDNAIHASILKNVQAAAQRASIKIMSLEARTAQDIDKAFSMMTRQNARAVMVAPGLVLQPWRQIAELAMKYRLPSSAATVEFVEVGGLMSYGQNLADLSRQIATYVDKIFKGAKPADLPVQQPTKFELAINRKTAKALGLTIPQTLLISADKVIE